MESMQLKQDMGDVNKKNFAILRLASIMFFSLFYELVAGSFRSSRPLI